MVSLLFKDDFGGFGFNLAKIFEWNRYYVVFDFSRVTVSLWSGYTLSRVSIVYFLKAFVSSVSLLRAEELKDFHLLTDFKKEVLNYPYIFL